MDTKENKIEKVTLQDGRLAERRTFYDDEGSEVVEVYVEPKRNLKLDKRVINKTKQVIAEQRIQTIRDGEVVDEEIHSIEPEVRLEKRQHIQKEGFEEHGDYVTKEQLGRAVAEGVVEAMKAALNPLKEQIEASKREPEVKIVEVEKPVDRIVEKIVDRPVYYQSPSDTVRTPLFSAQSQQPVLSAQSVVESNIEDKNKSDFNSLMLFVFIAIGQIGLLAWILTGW